jgi:hypothetical protein
MAPPVAVKLEVSNGGSFDGEFRDMQFTSAELRRRFAAKPKAGSARPDPLTRVGTTGTDGSYAFTRMAQGEVAVAVGAPR